MHRLVNVHTYKCIYTLTTSSLYPLSTGVICRAKLYINNEEYICVDLIVQDTKYFQKKTKLKTLLTIEYLRAHYMYLPPVTKSILKPVGRVSINMHQVEEDDSISADTFS